jgi:hypothetical protein
MTPQNILHALAQAGQAQAVAELAAQNTVEIWTEQDRFGMWSYDFVWNGTVYTDHDYQSRNNAEEAARSHFRSLQPTWTAPQLWQGVRVGHCAKCQQPHVLRSSLCWTCEQAQ